MTHSAAWRSRGLVRVARTDHGEKISALLLLPSSHHFCPEAGASRTASPPPPSDPPTDGSTSILLHSFLWMVWVHIRLWLPLPRTEVQQPLVSLCGSCLSSHSSQSRTQSKWNTMVWWLCLRRDAFCLSHLLSLHCLSLWHFPPTFWPQKSACVSSPSWSPGILSF